jgi:hypothetical protein
MSSALGRAATTAERRAPAAARAVGLAGVAWAFVVVTVGWRLLRAAPPNLDEFYGDLLLVGGAQLLAGVFWLRWFAAAYRTVRLAGRARFGMAYAVLGWMVPGLAIVAPKQLVDDVWRSTGVPGHGGTPLPRAVRVWSALWIATELGSLASLMLHAMPFVRGAAALLNVVALPVMAAYAVPTIRRLTERVALLPEVVLGQSDRVAPPSMGTAQPVT